MSVTSTIQLDDGGGSGGVIGGGGSGAPTPSPTPTPSPVPAPPPPPSSSYYAGVVASALREGRSIALSRIPLVAVPSQTLATQLGQQSCRIAVFQKSTGLYLNLYAGGKAIALGVLCRDRVWLVRDAYLGFTGDLCFIDTRGTQDPDYTGLADRFELVWGH